MKQLQPICLFVARLCLALPFLWAGVGKIFFYEETLASLTKTGLYSFPFLLFTTAILEIVGAFLLIFGFWFRFAALLLLIYLIPTTLIFHDFWNQAATDRELQAIMFFKNLAMFGGLIYANLVGPGTFSVSSK